MTLRLPAPAKLNLFLHIVGRRADGYHLLQTLFQFVDYSDTLTLQTAPAGVLELQDPTSGIPPEQNLILRAARLLQAHTGCTQGARIQLDKRLPLGGGIGGGSSDAATTLLGLNHLWRTELELTELAQLGLQLGADVPVFVQGRAAFAEGVGERLSFVEPPEPWYLVLIPTVSISTAGVFGHPELTRNTPLSTVRTLLEEGGHNDCQAVVENQYPEVAEALHWLSQYTRARLTGTGCCVFGDFPTRADADRVAARIPKGISSFVAQGCNLSPLHQALQKL